MSVLPNGKILAWQHGHHDHGGVIEDHPQPTVWDPNSGAFTSVDIPNPLNGSARDEIYCPGHAFMPNGKLLVVGGHAKGSNNEFYGSKQTHLFDYQNNSWSAGPDMRDGRWYPTVTALGDGTMLATAGYMDPASPAFSDNLFPEVLSASGASWRHLSSAQRLLPLYPWIYQAPNGKVFYAGPG
ncbi:MAG: hypothetical protein H0T45_15260, partial [Pyrinomonadaceae bacterium]|nr:hypothetical protein [Pyrinomonadaceae bacterium]